MIGACKRGPAAAIATWDERGSSRAIGCALAALGAAAAAAAALTLGPTSAFASATWRYEPAPAPPPPPGAAPAPYPVPLGEVGQISFWAPNRGLLITGGEGAAPPGLYAYDGSGWHLLSSVCGGGKGRIAWAGPDDFWTIADQREGQTIPGVNVSDQLHARSLCHFVDGSVVGSYAMPLGEARSYQPMDAAACFSPDDCWFAGADGEGLERGSFHLHWDGSSVTASYDTSAHAVTGMAAFGGRLYEGLAIGQGDALLPGEEATQPAVLRSIAPSGAQQPCEGGVSLFCNVSAYWEAAQQPLPLYPRGVAPTELVGFELSSDGSPTGAGAGQLWAGANPLSHTPAGLPPAALTIMREDARGNWEQILPKLEANGTAAPSPFEAATLAGSTSYINPTLFSQPGAGSIAPVPGGDSAWLSLNYDYSPNDSYAVVALLKANGEASIDRLPSPEEPVGFRGNAGPIACAAADDCWMATTEGWLFHLSDGAPLERNSDPFFDGEDGVIEYRPPDSGIPGVYPDGFAEDDSLANQKAASEPQAPPPPPAPPAKVRRAKPLLSRVKSAFHHHRVLVVSFTLSARARVQLIARRRRHVVAKTRAHLMPPGRHSLSLAFNRAHWPTGIQFEASPVGGSAPAVSAPAAGQISSRARGA